MDNKNALYYLLISDLPDFLVTVLLAVMRVCFA